MSGAVVTVVVEPLRDTFLGDVRAEAERTLAGADERAERMRAEAERRGLELVEQARADGAAAARLAGAVDQARSRRLARSRVLTAQREVYDELRRQVHEAVRALRGDPAYPALLERLSAAARVQLGEDVELEVDPEDAGGVRASSGARHVDYTLDALADRCLAGLGADVQELWR